MAIGENVVLQEQKKNGYNNTNSSAGIKENGYSSTYISARKE